MRRNRILPFAILFVLLCPLTSQAQYAGPTLSSPSDGTTGLSTIVTMSWNSVSGAVSYECLLLGDAAFTDTVSYGKGITGLSHLVRGLTTGKTYYWKARAYIAISYPTHVDYVWSDWSGDWSFRTLGIPPAPVLTSPSDGATGMALLVTAKWDPSQDATSYRFQLASDSKFSIILADDSLTSTSVSIGPLSYSTTYFWRVLAKNSLGSSSFSGAKFTTQDPPPAGTPLLIYPAANQTGIPVRPTMIWGRATNAISYAIIVSKDPSQTSIVFSDSTVRDTTCGVGGLDSATVYYWSVAARNSAGIYTPSGVQSFTTTVGLPGVPDPVSPPTGAGLIQLYPTLVWNPSIYASAYHVQIATDIQFAGIVVNDSGIAGTSLPVGPLLYSHQYFWRVRALNSNGASSFSRVLTFMTVDAPAAGTPQLVYPAQGEEHIPISVTARWRPVADAASYRLIIATDTALHHRIVNDSTLADTSRPVTGLAMRSHYYWSVSAINISGLETSSMVQSFSTVTGPPDSPVLRSPQDGATNIPARATVVWNPSAYASVYTLQVSNSPNFTPLSYTDSTITSTSTGLGILPFSTTFYWRVRAKNAEGSGNYSSTWSFTTASSSSDTGAPAMPGIPVLLDPENGAGEIATRPTLRWCYVPSAAWYYVQVSYDSTFQLIVIKDSLLTDTVMVADSLQPNTLYFWCVGALNTAGSSGFSAPSHFTTTIRTGITSHTALIPSKFSLSQNYPNPFNPRTVIRVGLPHRGKATLKVFDIYGKQVARLMSGEYEAGTYDVFFDGSNLASGIYFIVCMLEKQQIVRRMVLLK